MKLLLEMNFNAFTLNVNILQNILIFNVKTKAFLLYKDYNRKMSLISIVIIINPDKRKSHTY